MPRKNATPYPAQIKTYLSTTTGQTAVLSAASLLDQLEHSPRKKTASRVGDINKALARLWAEGQLIGFCDEHGSVLREKGFSAPGSAACEHPQVFGLPGTASPEGGFEGVSYEEAQLRAAHNAAVRGREVETVVSSEHPPEGDAASLSVSSAGHDGAESVATNAQRFSSREEVISHVAGWEPVEPVPDWLPEELLRDWCCRPEGLRFFNYLLQRVDPQLKKQIIQAGLSRKGPRTRLRRWLSGWRSCAAQRLRYGEAS